MKDSLEKFKYRYISTAWRGKWF